MHRFCSCCMQLILNEQYMVSAHDPGPDQPPPTPLTNKVIKVLSLHGSAYKTFGENIILVLNRESQSPQHYLDLTTEMKLTLIPPFRRNLPSAPYPQSPLPPLHHPCNIRILLHQRPSRPRRRHDPQFARPTPLLHPAATHLPPCPIPPPRTHPAQTPAAPQTR